MNNDLPAGQKPTNNVFTIDGKPFNGSSTLPIDFQLKQALSELQIAATSGGVKALWGLAEIDTPAGPMYAVIRYGVGSNPACFTNRLVELVRQHDGEASKQVIAELEKLDIPAC